MAEHGRRGAVVKLMELANDGSWLAYVHLFELAFDQAVRDAFDEEE